MKKLLSYISIFTFAILFAAQTHIAYGVGASPLRMQLNAMPGETVEGLLRVSNSKENPVKVVGKVADFIVNEDEAVQFLNEVNEDNIHSMQEWIELPAEDVIIEGKNNAEYIYKVNVPEDAKAQSYYGVVFVADEDVNEDEAAGGGISLNTQVAHLVLLEVGNNLHAEITLQSFDVKRTMSGEEETTQFDTVFFNSGNTHTAQEGRIQITDKNKNVIDELPLNKGKFNNLPNRTKTSSEIWPITEVENGIYFAYMDGVNPSGEEMNAEVKFRISDNEDVEGEHTVEMLESNLGVSLEDAIKQDSKMMLLKLILVAIGIALLAGYSAVKVIKKRKTAKGIFKVFGIVLLLILLSNITVTKVMAQDADEIAVSMEVDVAIAELSLDGCWEDSGGDTWGFTGTGATLLQPGDRENPDSGDPYAWYDIPGSSANDNAGTANGNSFAYDDCQFNVSVVGHNEYDITLHAGDLTDGTNTIPDMQNSNTVEFDFTLDSEDPSGPYAYVSGQGEHGFFVVDSDATYLDPLSDTGTAAGVTYTTAKDFDAATCGGGTRPCYHFIPASGNEHTIFDETSNSGGDFQNKKFVVRLGLGTDDFIPAGTYAMDSALPYSSTPLTITLTPAP